MLRQPVPSTADVVVVGGGALGTAIAFHLAEAGVERVVLIERAELGSGSTSKAAGGVRTQFSDPLNIEIGRRSLAAFAAFAERPGWEIDLHRVGYLFLLTTSAQVEAFEASIALQRAMGIANELVDPARARELSPLISTDGVMAAGWSPGDGHATPEAVVAGYASGAARHGAALATHCELQGIDVRSGAIAGVQTSRGRIATPTVVCAAGAWSRAVGAMAGVELPVEPLRRQVLVTEPYAGLPARVPLTIDLATGFYFHREGPGLLMGMPDPEVEPGFDAEESDAFLPALHDVIARRAPALLSVGLRFGWSGLHEMTPDHNALIGESHDVPGFFYATGFSGHGFQQAPAVGEILRDLILGRPPELDATSLHAERFRRGHERRELHVV
jgi:sarcosine oxidase subunit beta